MPILDIDGEYKTKNEIETKRVYRTNEEMGTSILYNKDKELTSITNYIGGMEWEVSYFLQIRNMNDTHSLPDVNLPATVQKYNRIDKLIIYLQSPISQENVNDIQGEAIINCGYLPYVDDVFLATLTGGREALFCITNVETRTYGLYNVYYISFKLFCFVDDHATIYNDLLFKVIKTYIYDKDHLLDYSSPIILEQDYKKKLDYKRLYADITEYYFKKFINKNVQIIAVPTVTSIYTDTLLNDFLSKLIDKDQHNYVAKLSNIHMDRDHISYCLWDVIIQRNIELLKRCETKLGFIYYTKNIYATLAIKPNYLGINFLVDTLEYNPLLYPETIDISVPGIYKEPIANKEDTTYVLSEYFYNNKRESCGPLEQLLIDYLNAKIIDTTMLDDLINSYIHWPTMQQYYLIPILMVLIKDTISNTFKSL